MTQQFFGTDGIRGRVGTTPMTADFVLRLGQAAGIILCEQHLANRGHKRPTVLIGKDTRISGYMLEAALEAGFSSVGVDVVLAGPIPTPAVAYLVRALRLSAGVVISASHNPYHDNGIKFFSAQGSKLNDAFEHAVEAQLKIQHPTLASEQLGRARRLDDAVGRYIEFCKSTFPSNLSLSGLKVVLDCAHGAAYHSAPLIFHELGATVITIGNTPDGFNINAKVGATHIDALCQATLEHQADLGIALDGDADRVVIVEPNGDKVRFFDGDQLLYAIVKNRLQSGEKIIGAVGTLMSNLGLESAFKKMGIAFVRSKVGDRFVLEALQENGWLLGAENSGHILCLDKHSTGDGTVSALQVLAALVDNPSNKALRLSDYLSDLTMYPQVMINVPVASPQIGKEKINAPKIRALQHAIETELGDKGRVLLRPSGTEALIRVMVEAKEKAQAQSCAERLADAFN